MIMKVWGGNSIYYKFEQMKCDFLNSTWHLYWSWLIYDIDDRGYFRSVENFILDGLTVTENKNSSNNMQKNVLDLLEQ